MMTFSFLGHLMHKDHQAQLEELSLSGRDSPV